METSHSAQSESDPHVFLIGRPPISELLGFIRNMTVGGQAADFSSLTDQWRKANDHATALEQTEAGAADNPVIDAMSVGPDNSEEFARIEPMLKKAFQFVPTEIAMVDLDQLVVFQKFINLRFVEELKAELGPSPSADQLFRFALLAPQQPPFRMIQNTPNLFSFSAQSTDFRFLEAQMLHPSDVPAFESSGRPVAILALAIGYGSNFLNVVSVENRLVLNNGSHRAYALRDLGIRKVPALVQRVSRRDELELVASGDLATNPDRYLKAVRPPMLKDYFDPGLRVVTPVYRKNRTVRVQFGAEQSDMPT